ncbi:hypothetical protein GCM10010964_36130 [Caldovatus sediminis]|uniref:Uncharacterized protein n=1 Tax=Caldovatus sediminis TaxID=2041189 RepID=A0A8J2ZEI9_9PROT|nr:hypothetical protein [Caldovatus sediminis]GGG45504.1 hypothetical protein GCM10010964_36130 [Caldovatus sediminis]
MWNRLFPASRGPRRGASVVGLRFAAALGLVALLAGTAAAQSDNPSFNIVNRSGQTINEIYVSAATQDSWGRDWLGQNVLPNGQSWPIRFRQGAECVNDIRVVYANGNAEERRRVNTCAIAEVVFGSGQAEAAPPAATQNPSFNLVNNSGRTIMAVYASPTREDHWGPDRLGQNVLPAGHVFAVRLPVGDCLYDIRVVYDDNSAQEKRRVDTCNLVNVAFP